jgi:hypothetical protein
MPLIELSWDPEHFQTLTIEAGLNDFHQRIRASGPGCEEGRERRAGSAG